MATKTNNPDQFYGIWITLDLKKRLRKCAAELDIKTSEFVRQALETECRRVENDIQTLANELEASHGRA